MQAILTGIYSHYNTGTNTLKTNLTGGLHLEMAPQGTALPYGTINILTGRPEYLLGGEMMEIVNVQFDIFAASNADRVALYSYLTALFDDARPTIVGYTSIVMERTMQQMLRDGDQSEIFRYIVEYQLTAEKN